MAEKRMFAKSIIDSDAFMSMPSSTQCLYFHLCMRADDDGFVNSPKIIQRMVGASDDDFKILLSKRFILAFDSGIIVIKHWRLHNYIRRDTYKETLYVEEKSELYVKPDGAYTDHQIPVLCEPRDETVTKPSQVRDETVTQIRLDKIRLDKDREDKDSSFEAFWSAYPKKQGKEPARKSFKKISDKVDIQTLLTAIAKQKQSEQWQKSGGQFIPLPSTWLNQHRWEDEVTEPKPYNSSFEKGVDSL